MLVEPSVEKYVLPQIGSISFHYLSILVLGDLPQTGLVSIHAEMMSVNILFYTHTHTHTHTHNESHVASSKVSICQSRRCRCVGLIPGLVSSPGGGNGNSCQYSCLEIPMDRGAWWLAVRGVTKSWTWLSDQAHTHIHILWGISESMQEHLRHFISFQCSIWS